MEHSSAFTYSTIFGDDIPLGERTSYLHGSDEMPTDYSMQSNTGDLDAYWDMGECDGTSYSTSYSAECTTPDNQAPKDGGPGLMHTPGNGELSYSPQHSTQSGEDEEDIQHRPAYSAVARAGIKLTQSTSPAPPRQQTQPSAPMPQVATLAMRDENVGKGKGEPHKESEFQVVTRRGPRKDTAKAKVITECEPPVTKNIYSDIPRGAKKETKRKVPAAAATTPSSTPTSPPLEPAVEPESAQDKGDRRTKKMLSRQHAVAEEQRFIEMELQRKKERQAEIEEEHRRRKQAQKEEKERKAREKAKEEERKRQRQEKEAAAARRQEIKKAKDAMKRASKAAVTEEKPQEPEAPEALPIQLGSYVEVVKLKDASALNGRRGLVVGWQGDRAQVMFSSTEGHAFLPCNLVVVPRPPRQEARPAPATTTAPPGTVPQRTTSTPVLPAAAKADGTKRPPPTPEEAAKLKEKIEQQLKSIMAMKEMRPPQEQKEEDSLALFTFFMVITMILPTLLGLLETWWKGTSSAGPQPCLDPG